MRRGWSGAMMALSLLALSDAALGDVKEALEIPSLKGESKSILDISDDDADQFVYIGGGAGIAMQRRSNTSYYNYDNGDDSVALRFVMGYQYNRNFATEVGYFGVHNDYHDDHSYVVSGVGGVPITSYFSLMAKLGLGFYNTQYATRNGSSGSTAGNLTYGVIAAFDFGRHLRVRVDYDGLRSSSGLYDIVTLNATYKF